MNNILGTFIIAYLAFMTGGWYVKDEAIKYVDDKCNTGYIIETYRGGHFYECKPMGKQVIKQMNKQYKVKSPNLIPLFEEAKTLETRNEFISSIKLPPN